MQIARRHISLSTGILLLGLAVNGQVRIGAKFGLTFPHISYTQPNGQKFSHSKTGILAGAFLSVPLIKQIELRPGMELTGGYGNVNYSFGNEYYSFKEDHTYLDLPVYILYTPQTKDGKFLLGVGPVMKNMLSNNLGNYKSLDWAVNGLAGYEVPVGFSFNLNYQKSLTSINKDGTPSSRRYFGLTVGYLFLVPVGSFRTL